MRGRIFSRFKGSYSIVVSLGKDPATGKYKQHFESIKGTRKDAEKRLAELLHQLDTGTFMKPGKTTVADFLEAWLKDYCKVNLAPHTTQTYEFFVRRHIVPSLGQIPLTQLKPEHLQRLYSEKLSGGRRDGKAGLGARSVRYIHTTIHRALKSAIKLGLISRNPADIVEVPRVQRREMKCMSETDVHLFLDYARATAYYALFYMALFTGLRRSELLALRWSDVDLILGQLYVTRTLHQIKREVVIRQPKTTKGKRLVALSPSTCVMLREHRAQQELSRKSFGLTLNDSSLIFSHYDGSPLHPDSVSQAWRNLARRIGLQGIRLHDARHTHASLMLKQGIHPKIVQERLGHASIQITLDTYSHVVPGLQQAAATRFDDIVLPESDSERFMSALEK